MTRLKQYRNHLGKTQSEMADYLDVTELDIKLWENKPNPAIERLCRVIMIHQAELHLADAFRQNLCIGVV